MIERLKARASPNRNRDRVSKSTRCPNGSLALTGADFDAEIEKLGETFMKLEDKMGELKKVFGFEGQELNLNLGPLGNLM